MGSPFQWGVVPYVPSQCVTHYCVKSIVLLFNIVVFLVTYMYTSGLTTDLVYGV